MKALNLAGLIGAVICLLAIILVGNAYISGRSDPITYQCGWLDGANPPHHVSKAWCVAIHDRAIAEGFKDAK